MASRSRSLLLVLGSAVVAGAVAASFSDETTGHASRKGAQVCASKGERAMAASWGVLALAQAGGTVMPLSALIKAAKVVRSALNSAFKVGEGVGVVVLLLLLLALMPVWLLCV